MSNNLCVCVLAIGYIIAEDVHASLPLPPFPASIKDGYAVVGKWWNLILGSYWQWERERGYSIPCLSASDGVGERKVVAPIAAGEKVSHTWFTISHHVTTVYQPSVRVEPGHVSRITTGAPLPDGADAVVQVEDTELIQTTEDVRSERERESFDFLPP